MADTATQSDRRSANLVDKIQSLEASYKTAPDKLALELATAYLDDGRPHAALRVLEKAPEANNLQRQVLLAQAYFDLFDNAKAAEALKSVNQGAALDANSRAQLLLGELAFENADTDGAKTHLRRALKDDPNNRRAAELLRNLGENVKLPTPAIDDEVTGFRTEDPDAEKPSRAALHVFIGFVVCASLTAVYLWSAHRTARANEIVAEALDFMEAGDVPNLRSAEEKFKESLDIKTTDLGIAGLAETYALLWVEHGVADAEADAEALINKAIDKRIQRAERYGAEALFAVGRGEHDKALAIGEEISRRGGSTEKVYYAVGLAERALGKHQEGRENLRKAQDSNSRAAHYGRAVGDAYYDDNDTRNATAFWERTNKGNSNYLPGAARHQYGRMLKGEPLKAIGEELERLAELNKDDRMGHKDLAILKTSQAALKLRLGKLDEALGDIDNAIALQGPTPRSLALRGTVLLTSGKVEEGLKELEEAQKRSHAARRYVHTLANAYRQQGKAKQAVELLEGLKDKYGKEAAFLVALGNAYRDSGEFAKAENAYKEALEQNENFPNVHLERGIMATTRRQFDAAAKHFEAAVSARTRFPEVYEAVGLLFLGQGDANAANTQWQEAERQFLASGTDSVRLQEFYATVASALSQARGPAAFVTQWQERAKALQEGM